MLVSPVAFSYGTMYFCHRLSSGWPGRSSEPRPMGWADGANPAVMSNLDHNASANSVVFALSLKWSVRKTLSRLELGMSCTVAA